MVERVIMGLGSSGPFVRDLQLALNSRLMPSPNLMVNGVFNAKTLDAIAAFQDANWLHQDGQCDQATLDCLYGAEVHTPIQHNLRYAGQPGPRSGWAAMVAMLRGTLPANTLSTTPQSLVSALDDPSSLDSEHARHEARQSLARLHGVVQHQGFGLTVPRLIEALRKGPIGLERLTSPLTQDAGATVSRHLVVAAARGSHGIDGATTTLRIYDPNPTKRGGIYSLTYARLLRSHPGSRFVMFTRQNG